MKGLFQCPRGTEGVAKTIEGRFSKKRMPKKAKNSRFELLF